MNEYKKILPAKTFPFSCFILKIGEWKKLFPEEEYKFMIAKAFNQCTYNRHETDQYNEGKVSIAGYLITDCKVCLVIDNTEPALITRLLMMFYDKIRELIRLGLDRIKKPSPAKTGREETAPADTPYHNLFEKYPFTNYQLIKLITGQKVDLHYYDPHLALMKDRLQDYNFCSVINYAGAKGPVRIKKVPKGYGWMV